MNPLNESETEYFLKDLQNHIYEIPAQATYFHQPKLPLGLTPTESTLLLGPVYR